MSNRLYGPGVRGIVLSLCFGLLAACGQNAPQDSAADGNDGAGSDISAPLPPLLASSWSQIKGAKEIDVVVDKGTDHELRVTLKEGVDYTVSEDGTSFAGKFKAKLTAGSHTFDLEYFVLQDGGRLLVGEVAASPTEIVAGKENRVDFSLGSINTKMDDDGDGASNLVEVTLETNPKSKDSVPSFTVAGITPGDTTTDVSVLGNIVVTFSKSVVGATVTADTFKVTVGGNAVNGAFAVVGDTVTFTPAQPLPGLTLVTVTLSNGLHAVEGEVLTAATYTFTTEQVTPPRSLAATDLPLPDAVNALKMQRYIIGGLTAGAAYRVAVEQLTADADLRLYDDAQFTGLRCPSARLGLVSEACIVTASPGGELFVAVFGTAAGRANYTLTLSQVADVTAQLPYTGEVGINETRQYVIGGFQPNARVLVEALQGFVVDALYTSAFYQDMGNYSLKVYSDAFFTLSCASSRGGNSDPDANEGCIGTADGQGQVYIQVTGLSLAAENTGATMKFILRALAPESVMQEVSGGKLSIDLVASARALNYYVIKNLSPNTQYVVEYTYERNGAYAYDVSRYAYGNDRFADSDGVGGCRPWSIQNCAASSDGNGNLYVVLDAGFDLNTEKYSFVLHPWESVSLSPVFSYDGDAVNDRYFKVSGLDPAKVYGALNWKDDRSSPGGSDGIKGVYQDPAMLISACGSCSYKITQYGMPNAQGELYVRAANGTGKFTFTVANAIDNTGSTTGHVGKGKAVYVFDSYTNAYAFTMSAMQDDADLRVFQGSLAAPFCQSTQGIGTGGSPLNEICGVHDVTYSTKLYYVEVDGGKTTNGTDFSLAWDYIPQEYAFGVYAPASGAPGSAFPWNTSLSTDKMRGHYNFASLDPGAAYTVQLTNVSGGATMQLSAYTGAIEGGKQACSVAANQSCVVSADASGGLRLRLQSDVAGVGYTLDIKRNDPPVAKVINVVNDAALLPNENGTPSLSRYYEVSGLTAGTAYTIVVGDLSWSLDREDVDLYVYDDANFTVLNAKCPYSVGTRTTSETCSGVLPNASNKLYLRLYDRSDANASVHSLSINKAP